MKHSDLNKLIKNAYIKGYNKGFNDATQKEYKQITDEEIEI